MNYSGNTQSVAHQQTDLLGNVPSSNLEVRLARFLFATGLILSPLTIGNDTLVNYPLSHFLAYLVSGNTPPTWVFLYCYIFTNILGFVFMFLGSGWSCRQGLCARIARKPLAILKGNARRIIINVVLFSSVALPLNYFFGDWIKIHLYQPMLSSLCGAPVG